MSSMYLVSVRVSVFSPTAMKSLAWNDNNSQKIIQNFDFYNISKNYRNQRGSKFFAVSFSSLNKQN